MKKFILAMGILAFSSVLKAEDIITMTLLDHVMPVTQFKSGQTNVALLDSVVQIGNHSGRSLLDLQAGINSNVKPAPEEVSGADLVAGGFFKVSSLIHDVANFPAQWEFLNALEHGPYIQYDFRRDEWYGGYQVGLAFELNPKQ